MKGAWARGVALRGFRRTERERPRTKPGARRFGWQMKGNGGWKTESESDC